MSKWKIGDVSVTKIVELEMTGGTRFLFPQVTPELIKPIAWLQPHFADENGRLRMSIHTFLVETPAHRIVVDTCLGNDKQNRRIPHWNDRQGPFLQDLAAAGFPPNSIDTVLCTHLHVDHVGWNTRLENGRWVPTFPKARYVMADRELAFWTHKEKEDPAGLPWITDSVLPIVAANRAQVVKSDFALNEAVQFLPTPGHTIDHYSVLVGRPGRDALIAGDMIHSPIQGRYPELGMRADYDSAQAGATRRRVFDRFCDTSTLMCVTHFPQPSISRVQRWGEGYKFVA